MSVRDLTLRFYEEIFNQGSVAAIDELVDDRAVMHGVGISERTLTGRAALREQVATLRAAFPDIRIDVEDLVCGGSRSAMRCKASGTHLGDAIGVPATGRRASIEGVSFCRWRDGKLVESWNHFDLLSMYRQLGLPSLIAGADPDPSDRT